jgi:hypothetical protein
VLSGHTQHGLSNPDRAAARRAYHAEHGRSSRAKKKGLPTPPARPLPKGRPAPAPPATRAAQRALERQPATMLAPASSEDATLARARARIAARHGTTPCSVCGTAKGASRGSADERPYRDRLGRCCACHEANVLRSHLGTA